ncbi:MAG TPA: ABC transporter permease [Chloroflexota bacterium]|nr:ABC transporter permease [Chloroflexota bacterium]
MASAAAVAPPPAIRSPRPRHRIVNVQVTIGLVILAGLAAAAIILPFFVPLRMLTLETPLQSPSWSHPMGLGENSQDIFSEWIYAARYSLTVGLAAGLGSTALSIAIGASAGYVGGWADDALSFLIRVVLLVPPIPALYVVGFALGIEGLGGLILLLSLMTWAYGADLIRSQVVALRQQGFVLAATAAGESPLQVMVREVLPHLRGLVLFVLVNAALFALQSEFALEFLGWDALANANSLGGGWGMMLTSRYFNIDFFGGAWWVWTFPGLGIMVTTAALALISAGLAGRERA